MRNIIILGSTGSIGAQALEVLDKWVPDTRVIALSCGSNIKLLARQIKKWRPLAVSVGKEELILALQKELKKLKVKKQPQIFSGTEGLVKLATLEIKDSVKKQKAKKTKIPAASYQLPNTRPLIIGALVGAVGLKPIIAAIQKGRDIALANKEVLVCAGELVMNLAREKKAKILPIDSEHSAIWQCLSAEGNKNSIHKLIITCSGGPFLGQKKKNLENITAKQALKHPNWEMGGKISIDSATLMNKGLEVIEARWLFDVGAENIEVVIHPESIIHSLAEFQDHSTLAQMGEPTMLAPIQYALTRPKRLPNTLKSLDLAKIARLTFQKPDTKTFPCLAYAYAALKIGGTMPGAINAANEVAVHAFLAGKIRFLDIPRAVKNALNKHKPIQKYNLEDVYKTDEEVREMTKKFLKLI